MDRKCSRQFGRSAQWSPQCNRQRIPTNECKEAIEESASTVLSVDGCSVQGGVFEFPKCRLTGGLRPAVISCALACSVR